MNARCIYTVIRFCTRIGIIGIGLLVVVSIARGQDIELPRDPLAGERVLINKGCVKCHSIFDNGGKVGRDLGKTLTNLSPTGIFSLMWNHSPEMSKLMQKPQTMPVMTEKEMRGLMAFIYFIPYFDQKGDAKTGERVFKEKQCLACHTVNGGDGQIGPALGKVVNYPHPLLLAKSMWNHGMTMIAKMSAIGIQRPTFTGMEITNLSAYLNEINTRIMGSARYIRAGNPRKGEKLFHSKGCIRCHKIGKKDQADGPDLAQKDFHDGSTQIAASMWNHRPKILEKMEKKKMRPPIFEENEMADLTAYLYFLRFMEQKGNVDAGKKLFARKGCEVCHAVREKGGNVGPDLAGSDETVNYIRTTAAMWNHNQKMRILMEKVGVPMPRFNENEMRDLFFYLRTERMKYEF